MKTIPLFHCTMRLFLSIILVIFVFTNHAEATNSKITGRITDRESKEPIPGVNVVVTDVILSDGSRSALRQPLGASTDLDGYYFILNVPPGSYVVVARAVGYTPITQTNVKAELDRTITLDFALASSAVQVEEVVVVAKREAIKQDVSATQEVLVSTRLEEMPLVRLDEFIGKVKGIQLVSGAEGNGLSVRGGAIRETDVRLDGISLQDPRSENSYIALNSTSVEEIQVLTGGFEAKYGGIRSGLLNIVTKEGQHDRYKVSLKADIAPSGQRRFFGTNPWSKDSWVYKVYSDITLPYLWRGIQTHEDSMAVPSDFWAWTGWKKANSTDPNFKLLDTLQRLDLWRNQHPQYSFNDKPNIYIEGTLTGPFPGSGIPILGEFADRTTFLAGFKYENSQLAFPLGPRNNYLDWNTQLKLTSQIAENMRVSVNGMYAKIQTVSSGQTVSYGGALVDASSSYGYLNNTPSSVARQASLLAGTTGLQQMFNKSRLQNYDQQYVVGGAKFTHTFSNTGFYTLDYQMGYTTQNLSPFVLDTNRADTWIYYTVTKPVTKTLRFFRTPANGSPNGSTNLGTDATGTFYMYGGAQRADSSHSLVMQLKGDMTGQIGRHHQIEAGFSSRLQNLFVYTGTWYQTQIAFTPDLWQYYKATPLELGAYIQDKLEFEGMILNAGLRFDYLNPMKEGFDIKFPSDEVFKDFYDKVYLNAPGTWGSYERWLYFRELLDNPPGWPRTPNKVQTHLSPRLGVSFPITETSKMYFNYGHFYQRPAASFLYNEAIYIGSVAVPTPDLAMARTVSYEFGYEQMILSEVLLNLTAYYKDNTNEPLSRNYVSYYEDNDVMKYFPDAYSDIRGIEIRLERPVGEFITFNAMYDYLLYSGGQSGLSSIYENRLKAKTATETRAADLYNSDPRPRANINLNFHTPHDLGPTWGDIDWFSGFFVNLFFEWQSGGRYLWNPEVTAVQDRIYIDVVNTWNIDMRISKAFEFPSFGSIEFVATVKNLTNNKWLTVANMTRAELDAYKNSLLPPNKGGKDKWGSYDGGPDAGGHIVNGWWEAPIFLNPRMILLGVRLDF